MDKTSLGIRMKAYEAVSKNYLLNNTPVVIRLDGKAFHSFTKGFNKPFDEVLMEAMQKTMLYLCENVPGCVFGYTQSDEITLVLIDYQSRETQGWFNYQVQKICSVAASMATFTFNRIFQEVQSSWFVKAMFKSEPINYLAINEAYHKAIRKGAIFDCRVFNLPKDEVINCLIWRQQDATRNSIQMAAQSIFSHKVLQGLNCSELQEKLFQEAHINWNDYPAPCKRGTACIKQKQVKKNYKGEEFTRNVWILDTDMPILTQDRDYINKLIFLEESNE